MCNFLSGYLDRNDSVAQLSCVIVLKTIFRTFNSEFLKDIESKKSITNRLKFFIPHIPFCFQRLIFPSRTLTFLEQLYLHKHTSHTFK